VELTGESDLTKLLQNMKPETHQGEYVFCLFGSMESALAHDPVCLFQEAEGVTAILSRQTADSANISYSAIFAWITLTIHSSLEAVGLTAAVSRALTQANISCNVVAAYFHDHILVPVKDAGRAMQVLLGLTEAHHE
jgi:hypothetical protein